MATNRRRHAGRKLHLNVSDVNGSGAGNLCKANDPVVVGTIPGVALTDEDGDGFASVDTWGVYALPVNAFDPGAAAGLAITGKGEEIYWDNAAGLLRPVPADGVMEAGGVFFGNATTPVAAAADADDVATCDVRVGR